MAINGCIFDKQKLPAEEHAKLFRSLFRDGIVRGCGISYQYNVCTISEGYFILAGRLTRVVGEETLTLSGSSGYARIRGVIDATAEATKTNFEQFRFEVDYAAALDEFSELTQEDINNDGHTYEVEWAVLSLDSSGITGISRSIGMAAVR